MPIYNTALSTYCIQSLGYGGTGLTGVTTAGRFDYGEFIRLPEVGKYDLARFHGEDYEQLRELLLFRQEEGSAPATPTVPGTFDPPVVDDFNRANGGLGADWAASFSPFSRLAIVSNEVWAPSGNGADVYVAPGALDSFDIGLDITGTWSGGQSIIEALSNGFTSTSGYGVAAIFRYGDASNGYMDFYASAAGGNNFNYLTSHRQRGPVCGRRVVGHPGHADRLEGLLEAFGRLDVDRRCSARRTPSARVRAIRMDFGTNSAAGFDNFRFLSHYAGGAALTQNVDDAAGITDAAATVLAVASSAADSASIADVATPVSAKASSTADTASISDSITPALNVARSLADTMSVADAAALARAIAQTFGDGASIADVATPLTRRRCPWRTARRSPTASPTTRWWTRTPSASTGSSTRRTPASTATSLTARATTRGT